MVFVNRISNTQSLSVRSEGLAVRVALSVPARRAMSASSDAVAPHVSDAAGVEHAAHSLLRGPLIAVHQFYDPSNAIAARTMGETVVPTELAKAMTHFDLQKASTWELNDGVINIDMGSLAKARIPRQEKDFWCSNLETASDSQRIAAALDTPTNIKYFVGSDSALRLTPKKAN